MRSHLMKGILLVVCVVMVSVPLVGQNGKGGGGGNTGSGGSTGGCALVTTPTVSTTTASPGMNVGVFGRVANCATGKKRYTVEISSMSSCGMKTIIASSVITFNAGEAKLISVSYPIAPNTCTGPMTVSNSVYSGGTMIANDSAALMVE